MTYRNINPENMTPLQHFHVPSIGGIDSMNPKSAVQPGTLMDCLNYEVALEAGYKPVDGVMLYTGKGFDMPISFLIASANDIDSEMKLDGAKSDPAFEMGVTYQLGYKEQADDPDYIIFAKAVLYNAVAANRSLPQITFVIKTGDQEIIQEFISGNSGKHWAFGPAITEDESNISDLNQTLTEPEIFVASTPNDHAGMAMSPDGQYMITMVSGGHLDSYKLLEPGDVTTAQFLSSTGPVNVTVGGVSTTLEYSIEAKPDGTKLYALVNGGDNLVELDMSTAWDVSTISDSGNNLDITSFYNGLGAHDFTIFKEGGGAGEVIALSLKDFNSDVIETLILTTPWSLSGANVGTGQPAFTEPSIVGYAGITSAEDRFYIFTEFFDNNTNNKQRVYEFSRSDSSNAISTTPNGFLEVDGFEHRFTGLPGEWTSIDVLSDGSYFYFADYQPDFLTGIVPYKFEPTFISRANTCAIPDTGTGLPESHSAYDQVYSDIASNLTSASSPTISSGNRINGLFFFDNDLYVSHEDNSNIPQLTKFEEREDQVVNEELVYLGREVKFSKGQNTPITIYDREFIEENVTPQEPIEQLGSAGESVETARNVYYSEEWESIKNATSDSGGDSNSAVSKPLLPSGNQWRYSERLDLRKFNIGDTSKDKVEVVGIEVTVRHQFDTVGTINAGTESGEMFEARLLNLGSTNNKADTTNRGSSDMETWFETTLGGPSDTWGATDLSTENLFSDDFGVSLQFRMESDSPTNTTAPRGIISVAWVKVKVYFTNADEKVYFWDPSSNSNKGSADVVNVNITKGAFNRKNASGYMTLYEDFNAGDSLLSVISGIEIRSAPDGAGNKIADTESRAIVNRLPNDTQMKNNSSFMTTITANFSIDSEKSAIYGVTGAGPAFHFNGRHFWFIHTPVPESQDKPRFIKDYQNHLVLGFDSGSIILSAPARPSTFSGVQGAVEFGFGDKLSGISQLDGNALAVISENSLNALVGSSVNNFTTQSISKTSGAIRYSVSDVGQPLYLDPRGISNISATQTFGDFTWGRLSSVISKEIQDIIQRTDVAEKSQIQFVASLPINNKNQYRMFFDDGDIITMSLFGADASAPMFTKQNYSVGNDLPSSTFIPTAFAQTKTVSGKTITVIGNKHGQVFVLDTGNPGIILDGVVIPYDYKLTYNPFFVDAPYLNIKYNEVMVHLKSSGYTSLTGKAGVNFLEPTSIEQEEDIIIGEITNTVDLDFFFSRGSVHLPNVTDGFVFEIEGTADGKPSHMIQALTYKGTPLGDRNSSPKQY